MQQCVQQTSPSSAPGPAGAWAAYHLARRGARVTIFDPVASARETVRRRRHRPRAGARRGRHRRARLPPPRHPPRAIPRLAQRPIGRRAARPIDDPQAHGCPSYRDGRSRSVDGEPRPPRSSSPAAPLRRGAARGRVPGRRDPLRRARHRRRARRRAGRGSRQPPGRFAPRFLIGADGANSLVRRRLARPFRSRRALDRHRLLRARRHQRRDRHRADRRIRRDTSGRFPRPTHLAIGICAQADAGSTAAALARESRRVDPRRRGSPTAPGSNRTRGPFRRSAWEASGASSWPGPNWCVVGDAAGLVDPITREGIYFALPSGAVGGRRGDRRRRGAVRLARALGHRPRARARGAAQGGVLPAGIHAAC